MSFVLPILFASIALITFVVAAAFFPIRITWFFENGRKKERNPQTPKKKVETDREVTLAPSMKSYRTMRDDDDYDDKEL